MPSREERVVVALFGALVGEREAHGEGLMDIVGSTRIEDGRGTVRSLTRDERVNFRAPFAMPPWYLDGGCIDERDDHAQNLLRHCTLGVLSSVQQLASEVRSFQELDESGKGSWLRFHAEGDGLIRRVPKADVCALEEVCEAVGEAVVEVREHAMELSSADALTQREATAEWK